MADYSPFGMMTPEMMAQLAKANFQPPPLMQAPMGGGVPQMQAPDEDPLGIGLGAAALASGLSKWKPDPTKAGVPTPTGDPTGGAGPAFLGGSQSLAGQSMFVVDPLTGQYIPNPAMRTAGTSGSGSIF